MGGLELPGRGFDEVSFRHEYSAVLQKGMADMIRSSDDIAAFQGVYHAMDNQLQRLADAYNPPRNVLDEMRRDEKALVNKVRDTHLGGLKGKMCRVLLGGIKSERMVRLGREPEQAVELLVEEGGFSRQEAEGLLNDLLYMGGKRLRDIAMEAGRSGNPGYSRFLGFLEAHGIEGVREAARKAKEELLSTTSGPSAKILRFPQKPQERAMPSPLRRIRQ